MRKQKQKYSLNSCIDFQLSLCPLNVKQKKTFEDASTFSEQDLKSTVHSQRIEIKTAINFRKTNTDKRRIANTNGLLIFNFLYSCFVKVFNNAFKNIQ